MTDTQPTLRFDHREIAVIFSLFVFVSLMMFTVGILVGKGLTTAKYEGALPRAQAPVTANPVTSQITAPPAPKFSSGSSVTTDEKKEPAKPIDLIPAKGHVPDVFGGSLREPITDPQAENILKNPRIKSLLEEESPKTKSPELKLNSLLAFPKSFGRGKFTVQVGSYPTEKDAADRVAFLKKLGFPYAYFSAKELGDSKETWYRVWLGYYGDIESAKQSGQLLQQRGEVKNYIVRKSDAST